MSILSMIGSAANWGLTAYGAYSANKALKAGPSMVQSGAGGRLLTGAVAGAAGYLAGNGGGGGFPMRRRRAKGLSGSDLKGFRRTVSLLKSVGMVPRKLSGARTKSKRKC